MAALSVIAHAALEPFDYPNGTPIAGQGGGTGWNGAWSAQVGNGTIVSLSGSLVYPGLPSAGGKMQFTGISATGTSTNMFRLLETPLTEGSITYLSFLA